MPSIFFCPERFLETVWTTLFIHFLIYLLGEERWKWCCINNWPLKNDWIWVQRLSIGESYRIGTVCYFECWYCHQFICWLWMVKLKACWEGTNFKWSDLKVGINKVPDNMTVLNCANQNSPKIYKNLNDFLNGMFKQRKHAINVWFCQCSKASLSHILKGWSSKNGHLCDVCSMLNFWLNDPYIFNEWFSV